MTTRDEFTFDKLIVEIGRLKAEYAKWAHINNQVTSGTYEGDYDGPRPREKMMEIDGQYTTALSVLGELVYRWSKGGPVLSVDGCARCGQDHDTLHYKEFANPIEDDDGTIWAYWATCPITGDPVLMRKLADYDEYFGDGAERRSP